MTGEMAFTIRRAANGDEIATCAALYERVTAVAFPWRPAGYHSAAEFLGFVAQEEVWLAEQDSAVLGLLSFYRPGNFIHALYVDPGAHGRGIGRALVETAAATATEPVVLKVPEPAAGARAFYARLGFLEADRGVEDGIGWRLLRRNAA